MLFPCHHRRNCCVVDVAFHYCRLHCVVSVVVVSMVVVDTMVYVGSVIAIAVVDPIELVNIVVFVVVTMHECLVKRRRAESRNEWLVGRNYVQ